LYPQKIMPIEQELQMQHTTTGVDLAADPDRTVTIYLPPCACAVPDGKSGKKYMQKHCAGHCANNCRWPQENTIAAVVPCWLAYYVARKRDG